MGKEKPKEQKAKVFTLFDFMEEIEAPLNTVEDKIAQLSAQFECGLAEISTLVDRKSNALLFSFLKGKDEIIQELYKIRGIKGKVQQG